MGEYLCVSCAKPLRVKDVVTYGWRYCGTCWKLRRWAEPKAMTFRGYVVDMKAKRFSKVGISGKVECVPFESDRGQEMIVELLVAGADAPAFVKNSRRLSHGSLCGVEVCDANILHPNPTPTPSSLRSSLGVWGSG